MTIAKNSCITEATKILKLCKEGENFETIARKLGHTVDGKIKTQSKNEIIASFTWTKLKSCGYMVNENGNSICVENPFEKIKK
jgi:hypothetical protein